MSAPEVWTPPDAAAHSAARAPVQAAIDAWSADWFADLGLCVTGWTFERGPRFTAGDGWRLLRPWLALHCSPRARTRLAGMALDVRLEAASLNERDRAVVDRFCERMLEALAECLQGALGGRASPLEAGPHVLARVSGADGDLLQLALPAATLAQLRRSVLPAGRKARPLDSRLAALAQSDVRLEAVLGEATISLPELRAMTPGDVLRLDRKLSDPAALSLVGGGFVAHAALTQADGRLALFVMPPSKAGTPR